MDLFKDLGNFLYENKRSLFGLSLFYVFFALYIPVITYRLILASVTGYLSWRPLAKNVFSFRDQKLKFCYYYFFSILVLFLSILALYVLTRGIIEHWPNKIPIKKQIEMRPPG